MTPAELKQALTILSGMFSPRFNTGHRVLLEPELKPLSLDQAKGAIMQLRDETPADGPFDGNDLLDSPDT